MKEDEVKELWIGDDLILKKSQRTGKFHGYEEGKVLVRIENKIVRTSPGNIETYIPPKPEKELKLGKTDSLGRRLQLSNKENKHSIDLHIDKLSPELVNSDPSIILRTQINRCNEFIRNSIENGKGAYTIIHGKGKGILRQEVVHLLNGFKDISFILPSSDGKTEYIV